MSTIVLKWLKHTGVDEPSQGSERMQDTGLKTQIDYSTIEGNLHEFVHSQYSCNLTSQVSTILRVRQNY